MKISIGADHRGFVLKKAIIEFFNTVDWYDVGTDSQHRTDYPLYARSVAKNILDQVTPIGILICGSGAGIAMAANRFKKIYAAVCWNVDSAKLAKRDDALNILVLPADFVTIDLACEIIKTWLETECKDGVYQQRLKMIDE